MTLSQFKVLLQPGGLLDSTEREVNINYDLVGSDNKVSAVAVRITGGNLQQLQNATKITLKIPSTGTVIGIALQSSLLPVRTINREQIGNYYLYSIVEVDQQPIIAAPTLSGTPLADYYSTDVIIEPTITNSGFPGSEYDVLLNNATGDRQSEYIQVSDRVQKKPNPQNLYSIINDNAILAQIQDSNYSNAGWIRGRYDGTKTDSAQYGGVEPALIGGVFKGAFFPKTYTETQIRALTSTDIAYQDYFFTGKYDAPTCEILPSNDFLARNILEIVPTDTSIVIAIDNQSSKVNLQPGNLLFLGSGTINIDPPAVTEVVKILSISSYNNNSATRRLEVLRGFGGTPVNSYTTDGEISYVTSNQFFILQNNKAQGLLAGKLLVKDSKELLYINAAGYSVSGSNG